VSFTLGQRLKEIRNGCGGKIRNADEKIRRPQWRDDALLTELDVHY
jgi:hypothetical protein